MKNGIRPQINTDAHGFKHGQITEKIIGVFFDVYNELGYGFLESVYQKSLGVCAKLDRHQGLLPNRDTGVL